MLQLSNQYQILLISCRTSHLSLKIPPLPLTNHEAKPCVTTIQKLHQHRVVQDNLALYHLHLLEQLSFLHSHLERRCNRRNIVQFGVQYSSVPIVHSHSWARYAQYTIHDHLDVLLFLICMFEQRCSGWWNVVTLALLPGKHFKTFFVHGKRCSSLVGHDDYKKLQYTLCPGHQQQQVFRSKEQTYLSIINDFPCCSFTFSMKS